MDDDDEKPQVSPEDRSPSGGAEQGDHEDHSHHISLPHHAAFMLCICLAQILSLASLAQTLVPLPIIGHDFGLTNPALGSWLSAAFSLTAGTFILPAGRLGDMFGFKRMYIIGFVFFAFWSLIAGFSVYGGFVMLAVCRGFQGIGSAIVVPNAMALVGTMYFHPSQEKKKHTTMALFGASAPTGFILGALFSTIFAQLSWWPWGFWVEAIILFANAVMAYFVIPPDNVLDEQSKIAHNVGNEPESPADSPESGSDDLEEKIKDMEEPEKVGSDPWGSLTGVCGLVLVSFSWNQAAVESWSTPYVIALLILGILFLVAFYFIEARVASYPLVPLKEMGPKTNLTLAVLAAGWGSFGIFVFYFFQLQQTLRGYLPLTTVAQNAAVIPSGFAAALLAGWLLSRIYVSVILFIATCCFLIGQVLLGTVPIEQIYWIQIFIAFLIIPFGMDMSFPSGTALVSAGMPVRYQGTASSLVGTVVNYSISMGLGFAGTINKNVGGPLTADLTGAGIAGPHGQAGLYPGGDFEKNRAFLRGFRASWYFAMGLDAVGVLIAAGFVLTDIYNYRKKKKEQSNASGEPAEKDAQHEGEERARRLESVDDDLNVRLKLYS